MNGDSIKVLSNKKNILLFNWEWKFFLKILFDLLEIYLYRKPYLYTNKFRHQKWFLIYNLINIWSKNFTNKNKKTELIYFCQRELVPKYDIRNIINLSEEVIDVQSYKPIEN